jgi:nitroimidazol reductase NimA-like FMN-containing flavoprotein (pyridoxamine 5'-phosphate oxidase superfamily)
MPLTDAPNFRELSKGECLELLGRNQSGRVAYSFHDRVDIEPISYVYADGWIYGRTAPGSKLITIRHHHWVAFEVDEIEGRYDWRSVVVHGAMYVLDPNGGDRDREAYATALEVVRSADDDALTATDPTPHRNELFRIYVDDLVGRAASTEG